MTKIKEINARQVLDSRGNPTLEADVVLADGSLGRASVPSGKSTGIHEAVELRDHDLKIYGGMSENRAVENVRTIISPALIGKDAAEQRDLDELMIGLDGTKNKSRLGGNAILAVSLAAACAQANSQNQELYIYLSHLSPREGKFSMPYAMFNIINGGVHVDNGSDFQEYMIVPRNSEKFSERLRAASEIFHTLGKVLKNKGMPTTVGDEGGYAPAITSNTEAFDLILEAAEACGYKPGTDVFLAIDIAASEFFRDDKYRLARENKTLSQEEMINYIKKIAGSYPIVSIEDPLQQEDFAGFAEITKSLPGVQTVGDDLYTTNPERLKLGIDSKSSTAVLIKPNQIGTLSETVDTIRLAYQNGMKAVVSHRSGDTQDTFIADLAVAMRAEYVKFGSLSRSERISKYNRLIQIEEQLTPFRIH